MKTIKSYTDIAQSRKLEEILPIESADMWYSYYGNPKYNPTIAYEGEQWFLCQIVNSRHTDVPCWSLAALLSVLLILDNRSPVLSKTFDRKYRVVYHSTAYERAILTSDYDNPVDACYEMILKLHELNLL